MTDLKSYDVPAPGHPSDENRTMTVQLSEAEAKARGLVKAKKAVAPKNKAKKAVANKKA